MTEMKKGNTMLQLFLSYVLLVIPMIVICFALAGIMNMGVRNRLEHRVESEILEIEEELTSQLLRYKNNVVIISTMDYLSPAQFSGWGESVRSGISFLKSLKSMDDMLQEVFLCYQNELYTSRGYCQPETFFGRTLGCDEDSIAFGCDILQTDEEALVYLQSSGGGYLLFHYPMWNSAAYTSGDYINSANYCIMVEEIYSFLEPLAVETDFCVQITFENEWQKEELYLSGTTEEGISEITAADYDDLSAKRNWLEKELDIELWGMKLSVSYDDGKIVEQVRFWQIINAVIMGILLLCAIFFSYRISKGKYGQIYRLRESLRTAVGETTEPACEGPVNEFDYMHSMIQLFVMKTGNIRHEADRQKVLLWQYAAMLLFYGGVDDEETALNILKSCNLVLEDPFFTVAYIALYPEEALPQEFVEWLTEGRIGCTVNEKGKLAVIVLVGLADEDYMQKQRKQFAEEVLRKAGNDSLISFSKPFEKIIRASEAFTEASVISEKLQQMPGERFACADTWEDLFAQINPLVDEEDEEREKEREKVEFSYVVDYIRKNYQRYDLSLDEVAEFAGLSTAYMSRLFKKKTGSRYIEYLTACRMEQAKRLLLETDMSIKQIAEAVGYNNVPGFRNKFKGYFGVNASEIRRRSQEDKE